MKIKSPLCDDISKSKSVNIKSRVTDIQFRRKKKTNLNNNTFIAAVVGLFHSYQSKRFFTESTMRTKIINTSSFKNRYTNGISNERKKVFAENIFFELCVLKRAKSHTLIADAVFFISNLCCCCRFFCVLCSVL